MSSSLEAVPNDAMRCSPVVLGLFSPAKTSTKKRGRYLPEPQKTMVGGLEHEFYDFPSIGTEKYSHLTNSIIFQRGR